MLSRITPQRTRMYKPPRGGAVPSHSAFTRRSKRLSSSQIIILDAPPATATIIRSEFPLYLAMQYRVAYEHSLQDTPDNFIVHVPSQLVDDVPANIPRALLPEYITNIIRKRSPQIAKIRNLRIL